MWSLNHQGIIAISFSYLHQCNQLFAVGSAVPSQYQTIPAQTKIKGLALIG
jgi:hypothetical protein